MIERSLAKIDALRKKQGFNPSPVLSPFNAVFLIRRSLYLFIKKYSQHFSGTILDFGCGSKPYKDLFNVQGYVGLDIHASGHNHNDSSVDVFYDGKRIPFDDNRFDGVFCSEVIEHIFNVDEVLSEIYRVLKLGSYVLITIPFSWPEHEQPYDYCRYTSFGIEHLLSKHGFDIVAIEKSGHFTESILQLTLYYVHKRFEGSNVLLRFLCKFIVLPPIFLIGRLFSMILPRDNTYYHNTIVLAVKK